MSNSTGWKNFWNFAVLVLIFAGGLWASAKSYLPSFLNLPLYFLLAATLGSIGACIFGSKDVYSYGRWVFGSILTALLLAILGMMALIADCATVQGIADDLTGSVSNCTAVDTQLLLNWFAITTSWQTGIGGGLALVGLVWAAYFDRKPTGSEAPDAIQRMLELHREMLSLEAERDALKAEIESLKNGTKEA